MTAPVFLFTPETIEPADAVASAGTGTVLMLTGPEARHAVTVKRLRAQERVDLVDGAGLRLVCEVTGAGVGGAKGRQRWQTTALQAAKQARRACVPEVEEVRDTRSLADWVGQTVRGGGVVLVLHEEASTPISTAMESVRLPAPGETPRALAVIVGPEGGISPEETAALEAAVATTVRLGTHVMRTASAGPVALAVLAHASGLWE